MPHKNCAVALGDPAHVLDWAEPEVPLLATALRRGFDLLLCPRRNRWKVERRDLDADRRELAHDEPEQCPMGPSPLLDLFWRRDTSAKAALGLQPDVV